VSPSQHDDSRLQAELRTALAAAEPHRTLPFAHVFARASAGFRAPRQVGLRRAAAAAAVAMAAAAAWLALPRQEPDASSDYRLALAVVAEYGGGSPTDRWLSQAPSSPLSGLPELPLVEYPLIPEENLL
jgi:hypothetical protein